MDIFWYPHEYGIFYVDIIQNSLSISQNIISFSVAAHAK